MPVKSLPSTRNSDTLEPLRDCGKPHKAMLQSLFASLIKNAEPQEWMLAKV